MPVLKKTENECADCLIKTKGQNDKLELEKENLKKQKI